MTTLAQRLKIKKENLCVNCWRKAPAGQSRCISCAEARRLETRRKILDGLCISCGKNNSVPGQVNCKLCKKLRAASTRRMKDKKYKEDPEWKSKAHKNSKDKLKLQVFEAYGGASCNCCGEDIIEFLTIDHVDGNGNKHRKRIGGSKTIYSWLKRNSYPAGFQVLCSNCQNRWKCPGGICPHKQRKTAH